MADNFLATLRNLEPIRAALAKDAQALTKRRVGLIARRAAVEADGARRHEGLRLALSAATARREKAGIEYAEALAAEMADSAAADGCGFATQREIAAIDDELRSTASSVVQAVTELSRQLRRAHGKLRSSPIPTGTRTVIRELRDGGRRSEIVAVADVESRAAELQAITAATRSVEELPLQIADLDEIKSEISAIRARFGLPADPASELAA